MTEKTDWNNLFKVRLGSSDDSFQKHEVVKLLIVMKILKKYSKRIWIRVYTELKLDNGCIADVYFEDLKNKAVYIFEVQKNYSKEWLETKTKQYKDYEVPFFNSVNFIPINLNLFTDDITEINKQLDKYIF